MVAINKEFTVSVKFDLKLAEMVSDFQEKYPINKSELIRRAVFNYVSEANLSKNRQLKSKTKTG